MGGSWKVEPVAVGLEFVDILPAGCRSSAVRSFLVGPGILPAAAAAENRSFAEAAGNTSSAHIQRPAGCQNCSCWGVQQKQAVVHIQDM